MVFIFFDLFVAFDTMTIQSLLELYPWIVKSILP